MHAVAEKCGLSPNQVQTLSRVKNYRTVARRVNLKKEVEAEVEKMQTQLNRLIDWLKRN